MKNYGPPMITKVGSTLKTTGNSDSTVEEGLSMGLRKCSSNRKKTEEGHVV